MAIIANLLAVAPTGLWEKIIFAFNGAFKYYALAIIMLTLCIKLLLLPLDYLNRKSSSKMTEVQTKLQPKMAEIQRKYPDKTIQNQKIGELYQKEGFNPLGSCLPMLISMVMSMVVFFTLFSGLNGVASYKITDQYEQLQLSYVTEYCKNEKSLSDEQIANLTTTQIQDYVIEISSGGNISVIDTANASVQSKYEQVREGFLWIKNVWIADSPLQRAIPSFESYSKTAGLKFENDIEQQKAKEVYVAVMGNLEKTQGVNGYFLLSILAAVSTFLSQYLLTKKNKQKENYYTKNTPETEQQKAQETSGKAMLIIFPIIMLIFTLNYNSIFAIYIVVSQLFSTATAPLIQKLINIKKTK